MSTPDAIGWISCPQRYRYEAPRQGVLMPDSEAIIQLHEGRDFDEALYGLSGFERIWVVFEFHLNETWHPRVQPPREGEPRRGVFATRSPHRPNRIGLSCVRLLSIDGLQLTVAGHDLLDQTPVWDLKPYVPYADAFPDAQAGWLDDVVTARYEVEFAPGAAQVADWIAEHGKLDCVNFARVQLMTDPTDGERKRIEQQADGDYVISYRTWRLQYRVVEKSRMVTVTQIGSGYSETDLAVAEDRHDDKAVHRAFLALSGSSDLADSSSST